MSFSTDVKNEIADKYEPSQCCKASLLYGLLISANIFDGNRIRFTSENRVIAELLARLIREVFAFEVLIDTPAETAGRKSAYHRVLINDRAQLDKILETYGYTRYTLSFRVSDSVFDCEQCAAAFVKGVFLSCGAIMSPKKACHLEFVFSHLNLSRDIAQVLADNFAEPKATVRKNAYVLYYKDSEQNEDFLSYIGAQKYAFEIMDTKILKDLRNNANRITNCETANIEKTADAARDQIRAIEKIGAAGRMDELPDDIIRTARFRMEYQEATLKEIGEMFTPSVTKSGINHRMRKIMSLAQEIGE